MAELRPGGPWVHHIVSSHMGVGVPDRGPFTYPEGWGVLLPEDPFITVNALPQGSGAGFRGL